jgi:hypothetical protein
MNEVYAMHPLYLSRASGVRCDAERLVLGWCARMIRSSDESFPEV